LHSALPLHTYLARPSNLKIAAKINYSSCSVGTSKSGKSSPAAGKSKSSLFDFFLSHFLRIFEPNFLSLLPLFLRS